MFPAGLGGEGRKVRLQNSCRRGRDMRDRNKQPSPTGGEGTVEVNPLLPRKSARPNVFYVLWQVL